MQTKLERRIAGLRQMTAAHGCTEAEALAALSKLELLEAQLPQRLWAAVEDDLRRYATARFYCWEE